MNARTARTARTTRAAHAASAASGAGSRSPTVPHRITVPVVPFAHPTPRAIRVRRSPR
ncbi:hypothetical protein ACVW19_002795 [Streptomyces sp. TE5632]